MSRYQIIFYVVLFAVAAFALDAFNKRHSPSAPPPVQSTQASPWVYTCAQLDPSDGVPGLAQVACLGYLRAFVDMHNMMATLATGLAHPAKSDISLMCVPRDTKAGVLFQQVDKWVANNPNRVIDIEQTYTDSNRAFALIVAALHETYPCEVSE